MLIKAPLPLAIPVTGHSCVTFCKTDFTANKHPPCSHSAFLSAWQHFNTRAQLLAFLNFSLAKYLSLYPATKLCQVPQADRLPSCRDRNGTIRSATYISGNHTYVRSLIKTPDASPAHTTHAQEQLTTWYTPTLLHIPRVPPTPLQRGCCIHTEKSDLGTDFFPHWVGCPGDSVLCGVTFHPAAGRSSKQQEPATHPYPMLSTQQHHKQH